MIAAFQPRNLMITIAESIVTATAAAVVLVMGLPLWVMFVGWIGFYTRGVTNRDGLLNYAGVLIGLLIGLGAALVLRQLGPNPTVPAQVALIFGVVLIVLSLRFLSGVNNLLAFFLGLVTFFAAHTEPALASLLPLAEAAAVGAIGGAVAHAFQLRLREPRP